MTSAFVAEFARRLQGRGAALALPLTWIEQRLAESGQTIEQLVQAESQQQAADQVSISNSIGSLRLLGAMDWREFVETLSVVEQTLREDPAGVYARMDFRHPRPLPPCGRAASRDQAHWRRPRWRATRWSWPRCGGESMPAPAPMRGAATSATT